MSREFRGEGSVGSAPRPSRARQGRDERFPLDDLATETLQHVAWLIARSGYSPEQSAVAFREICERIPRNVGTHSKRCPMVDAGQVMTLWYTSADYLDKRGRPIPIPLTGPAPSFAALVREVDERLTVNESLEYLTTSKALKRRGAVLFAQTREITLPAKSAYQSALQLIAVAGLLRTIEHNANSDQQWFQYVADGYVPERILRSAAMQFRSTGMQVLKYADDFILRRASTSQRKQRCAPLGVGLYIYRGPAQRSTVGNKNDRRRPQSASLRTKAFRNGPFNYPD